ncbi:MAG: MarR family winged helix-turn-helix transcriptional regulator [Microbacteriaceae bacterium]
MAHITPNSHVLTGFAAAASAFVSSLESNRLRIARDLGVTPTELRTLFYIGREMSSTPKGLAGYLGMTTGAVTAISQKLVESGLLHRVAHPEDRRSLYLELTPHGHSVLLEIHQEFDSMLSASTSALDPAELAVFTATLDSVAKEVRERVRSTTAQS